MPPLAIIGGGNMASAILTGATEAGVIDPARVTVAEPDPVRREPFRNAFADAVSALAAADRLDGAPAALLLAVKPQVFPVVARELAPALSGPAPRLVISILAGTTSRVIAAALGGRCRVIRVMPNTPAQLRRGMSAIAMGDSATSEDVAVARAIFNAVGRTIEIDEDLIDAFTAVAGSGPAYVFYLAEAMVQAASSLGLSAEHADLAVRQTIAGAAELLANDTRSPADLRAAVTSKNGTTFAATTTLDNRGVMLAVQAAITAARDRGREIGAG